MKPFQGALGMPLDAGRATHEVINRALAACVDDVEVGRRVAGQVRLALAFHDVAADAARATGGGASQTAPPSPA